MREVVPQRPWSFLARALGYRNQVRRYLLLVATLWPIVHLLTILITLAAERHRRLRNPRVSQDHRILWLILIFLGGLIAMPVYRRGLQTGEPS